MTTTEEFRQCPDYFSSKEACEDAMKNRRQSNPRYRGFNQSLYTAADVEQFHQYRDATNGQLCIPNISMENNIFGDIDLQDRIDWEGYKHLPATCVDNTFKYMFNKFKKGIFVKIQNNQVKVFLPFSKKSFINEWGDRIKYRGEKFFKDITEGEGYRWNPNTFNKFTNKWYANNCLVRYEYPLSENDSGVSNMCDMFGELCRHREIPDIEFFLNRRDFPLLKKDRTEPYDHIFDSDTVPLLSHSYEKYSPILGGAVTPDFADISIPTWEDWQRVSVADGKFFPKTCRNYLEDIQPIPWSEKIPTAIFRGGSTGCGVTQKTNPRLKIAYLSTLSGIEDGFPLLDAGITEWNLRPRKLKGSEYLQTIDKNKEPPLVNKKSPQEQVRYKYIVNIDGHVTAFRLSLELGLGSVVLLVESDYTIWFMNLLEPYVHYIPIKKDLSDLIEVIRWCRENDEECEEIANQAKIFYDTYLSKEGIFDYLQKILYELKKEIGIYLYNRETPLSLQIKQEYTEIQYKPFPDTDILKTIGVIPPQGRVYSLLQGMEWVYNLVYTQANGNIEPFLNLNKVIFPPKGRENNENVIIDGQLARYPIVVKTSSVQKNNENIHETFLGLKCINSIIQYIPNFAYILGSYTSRGPQPFTNVVLEYIHGIPLHVYIKSKDFNIYDYFMIILQLCLALQIAQKKCCFVHWDLMPWNIMIQKLDNPIFFDYLIDYKTVIRVQTKVIPIIIDYGKSHVVYNGVHYGYFLHMYKMSTIQDVITLLVSSLSEVTSKYQLNSENIRDILYLANFLSNTGYCPDRFNSLKDIKAFISTAINYTELITCDKHELEERSPLDLFNYILKLKSFPIQYVNTMQYTMNVGNSKQVFDFILSSTDEERIKSYENVFIRLKQCTIPQPDNLFFTYFAAQSLEKELTSVYNNMIYFLQRLSINTQRYENIYKNCMRFLHRVYGDKIQADKKDKVLLLIETPPERLYQYTEETFLLPEEVLTIISNQSVPPEDLTSYKDIIECILVFDGYYKLSESNREFYITNFKELLESNNITTQTNIAMFKTLRETAKNIYTDNILMLEPVQSKCSDVLRYTDLYSKIISRIE